MSVVDSLKYEPLTEDPGDELGNDTATPLPPALPCGPDDVEAAPGSPLLATATGPPGAVVKLARPLHLGMVGPDVLAVKRATARAFPEVYSWADFDQVYNKRLLTAWKTIQREYKVVPVTGKYGSGSHRLLISRRRAQHPGQWAWDQTSINLMEGEWKHVHTPPTPPIERVYAAMVDFMNRALANAAREHYLQRRAMTTLGLSPEHTMYYDCSEGATDVYFWPHLVTGIRVPDPNGRGFDGYGNTDTLWTHNASRQVGHDGPFSIGDLGLYYGHGGHVIVCLVPGDRQTSVWWSNGSESAPNTTRIYYRPDLRGIVRPVLIP